MYTAHFGFNDRPFTRDNLAPLSSASHEAAYRCLRQGLDHRSGLLLLTGPAGVGKTTLLHRLIRESAAQMQCVFIWNAHMSLDDLLGYIFETLESSPASELADRPHALETSLSSRLRENRPIVLAVDDAQWLPEETLAGLVRLADREITGQSPLTIILSGDPFLAARLNRGPAPQTLAGKLAQHCQMSPLSDQEVMAYVQTQLRRAGYQGVSLFPEESLRKIAGYAQGLPSLINLICKQALFLAYLNREPTVLAALIDEVASNNKLAERPVMTAVDTEATVPGRAVRRAEPATVQSPVLPPDDRIAAVEPLPPDKSNFNTDIPVMPVELGIATRRHRYRYRPWLSLGAFLVVALCITWAVQFIPLENISRSFKQSPGTLTPAPSPGTAPPTVPPPSPAAILSSRVRVLLQNAEQRMKSLDYVLPKGESALDYYRQVLQLDPGNREALQGIARMKASFLDWSELAEGRGDLARAQEYLKIVLALDPDDTVARRRIENIAARRALNTPNE